MAPGEPTLRIFKTKFFVRFARKASLGDSALRKAIADAERGLIDADLGGGVIKQRVAREGEGKSGGFRTIVLFRSGERAFFVRGFAKNELDNIGEDELRAFKALAARMLAYDDAAIAVSLSSGTLTEVANDG
jgi:hypothetical protein